MILTATIILAGLSPEVRRQSFLESYNNDYAQHQSYIIEVGESANNDFYLSDVEESIRVNMMKIVSKEDISQEVLNNSLEVIKSLPSLFIMNFDLDELYKTSYGTIVLEFTKNNSNFTIEIGDDSFGYFSEVSKSIKHINEELALSKDINNDLFLGQLNLDFVDFYNEI